MLCPQKSGMPTLRSGGREAREAVAGLICKVCGRPRLPTKNRRTYRTGPHYDDYSNVSRLSKLRRYPLIPTDRRRP